MKRNDRPEREIFGLKDLHGMVGNLSLEEIGRQDEKWCLMRQLQINGTNLAGQFRDEVYGDHEKMSFAAVMLALQGRLEQFGYKFSAFNIIEKPKKPDAEPIAV